MKKLHVIRYVGLVALLSATLTSIIQVAQGQSTQLQGVINGRSGATMTVQSAGSPNTVVLLTDSTSVGEVEGVFRLAQSRCQ
jgi:OmpA-OmpF porin, OOP family